MGDLSDMNDSACAIAAAVTLPGEDLKEFRWTEPRGIVLRCRHNEYERKHLLKLGSFKLGKSVVPLDDRFDSEEDKQIFLKTPIVADLNFIYGKPFPSPVKKSKKRPCAQQDVMAISSFRATPEAKKLLGTTPDYDSYHTADVIRKVVRYAYNRCANIILSNLFPDIAENLKLHPIYWSARSLVGSRENFDVFFGMLRDGRRSPPSYKLNLQELNSRLLPFQRDAVNFMIDRELHPNCQIGRLMSFVKLPIDLTSLYYFPYLGLFVRDLHLSPCAQDIRGGILADEMGLGKTVELLSLILSHTPENTPQPYAHPNGTMEGTSSAYCDGSIDYEVRACIEYIVSTIVAAEETEDLGPPKKRFCDGSAVKARSTVAGCSKSQSSRVQGVHWSSKLDALPIRFVCPVCIADRGMTFEISTTLIVVPEALLHQWFEEIRRHCKKDVVVDVYYGVGVEGYKHPAYLNSCDIVLCTYETFQKEIYYNPSSLRSWKTQFSTTGRTQNFPSPLLAVNFWRICLDESQLVASKVKAAAKMCSLLKSRYRWCVTGTPMSNSVNDLYGLMHFLCAFPYSVDAIWAHYFFYPWITKSNSSLLVTLMSQIMWRNTKKDVESQLENVSRKNNLVELSFSPIEERLYFARIEESRVKMCQILYCLCSDYPRNTQLSKLPSDLVNAIFSVINDVRASILAGESHKQKKDLNCISDFRIFSPKLIIRKLFDDAKLLVVQRHRDLVLNRNALAGLYLLVEDHFGAFSWYEKSIKVHYDQLELNQQFGLGKLEDSLILSDTKVEAVVDDGEEEDRELTDEDEEERELTDEDEEDKELTDKDEEDKEFTDEDVAKPIKPLSIDALQILHIASNMKELCNGVMEAKKYYEVNGIEDLARERHRHYVRAEVAACVQAAKKYHHLKKSWNNRDWSFNYLRMSYVIMLDDLFDTLDFDEFKEMIPMKNLGPLKKPVTKANPFDYLLVLDEELKDLRRSYHAYCKSVDSLIVPFNLQRIDDDGEISLDSLVPPLLHEDRFKKLIFCKHAPQPHFSYLGIGDGLIVPDGYFPEPDKEKCCVCDIIECEKAHQKLPINSKFMYKDKFSYEILLMRMYRVSQLPARDAVRTFHMHLLEWLELGEKMVSAGRELMTAVQEWVNREREIISSCSRFEFGMKVSFPFASRPVVLSRDNLDASFHHFALNMAITNFTEAEKQSVESVSGALSSLRYLNTLLQESQSGVVIRDCPCCYVPLDGVWVVFPCAHTVCSTCFRKLKLVVSSSEDKHLRCVTCRRPCPIDGTMYVVNKKDDLIPNIRLTVKFEHIIRLLKKLITEDPSNKVLVFTSIAIVIPPFAALLKLLKLPFAVLDRGSRSKILHRFRHDDSLKILLMPLRMGANGLNLTEANHVVFMEPITETSVLSQAIGRIDRIGQWRAVTVHNFVVRGSIEEEIYKIVNNGEEQSRWTLATLCQVFEIPPLPFAEERAETDEP
ncbi:unnamed protein product [Haemonchus placei]|uniref:SNF2-related n=1 Tax=Haemonchus placei TaxID=6290 RepID=A0A0N4W724_HAEPC|nr:unnamed protein product [Haemonchus placei]